MNPTKQQLENELAEVEISIDFYTKKIEQAESDKEMPFRTAQINTFGKMRDDLYLQKRDLQERIERMKNNE